jgi:hypothetical protein
MLSEISYEKQIKKWKSARTGQSDLKVKGSLRTRKLLLNTSFGHYILHVTRLLSRSRENWDLVELRLVKTFWDLLRYLDIIVTF